MTMLQVSLQDAARTCVNARRYTVCLVFDSY